MSLSFLLQFLGVRMDFWGIDAKQKIRQIYIRVRMVITKMYDISIINAAKIIFMEVTIARNGVPPIATIVGRFNLIRFDSIRLTSLK